jgi:hypothetical protein
MGELSVDMNHAPIPTPGPPLEGEGVCVCD